MSQEVVKKLTALISEIWIDPKSQVREDPLANVPDLAANIKEVGLTNAITIRPPNEKESTIGFLNAQSLEPNEDPELKIKWILITGRKRIEAYKLNGEKTIPINPQQQTTSKDAILQTVSENMNRNNLSLREEAKSFQAEITTGWHVSELAVKHSKTQEYINDRLNLLKLSPKIQQFAHKSQLGIETLKKAIFIAPQPIQDRIATEIVRDKLDLRSAQQQANRTIQEYEEQEAFKKLVQEAKIKTCPTCKKHPQEIVRIEGQKFLWCGSEEYSYGTERAKHEWNPQTGQTAFAIEQARHEGSQSTAQGKSEPHLRYSFRYDIPPKILAEAFLAKAVAETLKALKKGCNKSLDVTIDGTVVNCGFHVSVQTSNQFITVSGLSDIPGRAEGFNIEANNYHDEAGNLCKVNSGQGHGSTQDRIDEYNTKFEHWLNSLPEIAEYRRKFKKQKRL